MQRRIQINIPKIMSMFLPALKRSLSIFHDVARVNFLRILKQVGIKARVLYNLRHTYASHMIRNGVDIVYISKQLGHENPNITLTIYTRFIEEDDEKRLKKIAEIGTKMVTFKKGDS